MDAALAIGNLNKSFGGVPATQDVSLVVQPGERRLLLGPNGAGKTTLFNLITGDLPVDSGSIRLFGEEIGGLRPHRRAHKGIARTYQILTLFPRDSLMDNVRLALLGLSPRRWAFWTRLERWRDLRDRALAVLERVGLAPLADKPLAETSYGERRRLEIAMALAQSPRLLLLDEPLAGLSQEERRDMRALIGSIPRDVTVVLIEHDMDIALSLAEQVTVLHYGQVIAEGDRGTIVDDPRVREVYLGV